MWTALIGALAALAGVLVGKMWDAKTETRRFRREQMASAYQAALASDIIYDSTLLDPHSTREQRDAATERSIQAIVQIGLFGSEEAVKLAGASLPFSAGGTPFDQELYRKRIRDSWGPFLDQCRKDLGAGKT